MRSPPVGLNPSLVPLWQALAKRFGGDASFALLLLLALASGGTEYPLSVRLICPRGTDGRKLVGKLRVLLRRLRHRWRGKLIDITHATLPAIFAANRVAVIIADADHVNPALMPLISQLRLQGRAECWTRDEHGHRDRPLGRRIGGACLGILVYDSVVNRLKYPLMRKMFYDPAHALLAPYVMWFDDDSFLRSDVRWWARVHRQMEAADVLGSVYSMPARGGQAVAVRYQPWFAGKALPAGCCFTFATGGWWAARYDVLRRHDYPFKDVRHNGGDLALGEMLRQQRYRLVQFREGVCINADESGVESSAPRRGDRCKPVWYDFRPGERPDHSHHDFALEALEIAAPGDRC